MSSLTTLARPYAKAAFDLAQAENNLARWDEMLELASSLVTEPSMADLLDSPEVSSEQSVEIICEVAGDAFNDRFRGFHICFGWQRTPAPAAGSDRFVPGFARRCRETSECAGGFSCCAG